MSNPKHIEIVQNEYTRIFLSAAFLHLIYLLLYWTQMATFLMIWNGISIGFILWLLYAAPYFPSVDMLYFAFFGDIVVNALICSSLAGAESGFIFIIIGLIPLVYYINFMTGNTQRLRMGATVSCILVFAFADLYISIFEPFLKYDVDRWAGVTLSTINLAAGISVLLIFLHLFVSQVASDANALENQKKDLETSANIDALTKLLNRRALDFYTQQAIKAAAGEGKDFSILMLDIDDFKKVNDTYGHEGGDEVLRKVAEALKNTVRPDDIIFRYGGEEILILVNHSMSVAGKVGERCRQAIENLRVEYNGQIIQITVTIGGSFYHQGATIESLIERADQNLYKGKKNGKNQVVIK